MSRRRIFALDLGTTKFCLVGFVPGDKHTPGSFESICMPAYGVKRGMLSDTQAAQRGLTELLGEAEKQFQCDITKVIVGVSGTHLNGRVLQKTWNLPQPSISKPMIANLIAAVQANDKLPYRENLHVLPVTFKVDRREPLANPVGLNGRQLNGKFFVIDADQLYLKDIIKLCNQCGLEVTSLCAEPYASALVSITESQRNLGVALVDIGGGATSGVVYANGACTAVFSIAVGGNAMTSDLAIGLNLPPAEAERVKTFFGMSTQLQKQMEVQDVYGRSKILTQPEVYNILGPRILELTELLVTQLKPFKGQLGAGLMLTGGGAEVLELTDFFTKLLKIPVAVAKPSLELPADGDTSFEHRFPTKLATAFGLLKQELLAQSGQVRTGRRIFDHHYLQQFVSWLKELS